MIRTPLSFLVISVCTIASAQTTAPLTQPTRVTIRDDQMLLVNGEPFFPIGLYYTEKERADPSGEALKELRGIGFNSIFAYGEPNLGELDRAAAAGLRVQFGPPGGLHDSFDKLE